MPALPMLSREGQGSAGEVSAPRPCRPAQQVRLAERVRGTSGTAEARARPPSDASAGAGSASAMRPARAYAVPEASRTTAQEPRRGSSSRRSATAAFDQGAPPSSSRPAEARESPAAQQASPAEGWLSPRRARTASAAVSRPPRRTPRARRGLTPARRGQASTPEAGQRRHARVTRLGEQRTPRSSVRKIDGLRVVARAEYVRAAQRELVAMLGGESSSAQSTHRRISRANSTPSVRLPTSSVVAQICRRPMRAAAGRRGSSARRLGLAQDARAACRRSPSWSRRVPELEADVDGLLQRLWRFREVSERPERLARSSATASR